MEKHDVAEECRRDLGSPVGAVVILFWRDLDTPRVDFREWQVSEKIGWVVPCFGPDAGDKFLFHFFDVKIDQIASQIKLFYYM